jgi:hypothetical protein
MTNPALQIVATDNLSSENLLVNLNNIEVAEGSDLIAGTTTISIENIVNIRLSLISSRTINDTHSGSASITSVTIKGTGTNPFT